MEFEVVLQIEGDSGFSAYVTELPGCISRSDSKAKALKNIRDAIELYLEDWTLAERAFFEEKGFYCKNPCDGACLNCQLFQQTK